jgi:GxxExxY protein
MEKVYLHQGITEKIIGAAMEVHTHLGPGLLEAVYQYFLAYEFDLRGIHYEREKVIPVSYKDQTLECGYRLDFLVEEKVILELKAIDQLLPLHQAQLLTYLKLANCPVGLLINFNVTRLKNGIHRMIL